MEDLVAGSHLLSFSLFEQNIPVMKIVCIIKKASNLLDIAIYTLETARNRPKYCLKGLLNPKQTANIDSLSFRIFLTDTIIRLQATGHWKNDALWVCGRNSLQNVWHMF